MLPAVYFITSEDSELTHLEQVEAACGTGIHMIQLRLKDVDYNDWFKIAKAAQELCLDFGARLIVNDNVRIARDVGAAGVHLGRKDMDPALARQILGTDALIGCTANDESDLENLISCNIDYIGLGPYRYTSTKKELSPILGDVGIRNRVDYVRLRNADLPMVAVGGILLHEVGDVLRLGVQSVALSSDLIRRFKAREKFDWSYA